MRPMPRLLLSVVIVTLGGASVGDHDLVNEVLTGLGRRFHRRYEDG